jgi:hypothetical protein
MQTRKRAKSVTFGKKPKEKDQKEHVKKAAEEEVAAIPSDKEESVETPDSHVESQSELSATPPKAEETEPPAVETPSSEFVSDNPLATSPEQPAKSSEEPVAVTEPTQPVVENNELAQPVEIPAQPTTTPTTPTQPAEQPSSQELSSTLPPSAFTIQTNEQPAQETATAATVAEERPQKKRFGLYFLVVAFLSFILGLGAMAGASYLGLVHVNFSRLSSGVQMPGLLAQKPTPTVPPPTAAPTQKPVDLTAYTIAILNGSGISGKAADEKTALTTAGFKVTSTGNATNSSFTKTEISAKSTVNHDFLTKLENELNKSYKVDTTVATSPASDATDITVTLGSKAAQ